MLNEIRSMIATVQKIQGQFGQLRDNIQQLQQSMTGVNDFIADVNKDIAKWQFKSQPRLTRLQEIVDRLNDNK
jgi:peptidoglycan hydrolase CwlO-like protein